MPKLEAISVHTELDVVTARLQVREAARRIGFSLIDQAHISIATSSVAKALHLGKSDAGDDSILIEFLQKDLRRGVRITCRKSHAQEDVAPRIDYLQEGWLIDEIQTNRPTVNTVEVTLTKWA